MNQIIIDKDKCIGCQTCYQACWLDVIRWDEEANQPVVKYARECAECNWCEIACKQDAVEVIIDYDKPFPEAYIGK